MKVTLKGLLRLKPFDESSEPPPGKIYASNYIIAAGLFASFIAAIIAAGLVIAKSEYVFAALAIAAGLSAITAGLEWGAGIRARALNNLFVVVAIIVAISLLQKSNF